MRPRHRISTRELDIHISSLKEALTQAHSSQEQEAIANEIAMLEDLKDCPSKDIIITPQRQRI